MANSSLFLSVAVLLLLSQTLPYVAPLAPQEIAAICDQSLDRNVCLNFLETTPGISTADLKGAGLITLDSTRAEVADTEKFIKKLLGHPADPKMKESYKSCLESYGDASDDIEDAKASLTGGDYNGANIQASAAQTFVDGCDEDVKGSELSKRNQHLLKVLEIVLIIANKLIGH